MNYIILNLSQGYGSTAVFVWLLPCLFVTGCACVEKGKSPGQSAPQVTAINESLEPLKREFNADTSKPRLLALFSPTCGGCIYGAKALQHESQKLQAASGRAEVLIVWVAMLETDNEREARKAAKRFDIQGARHFYDGERRVGARLMREQFPNAVRDALEILPRDDEMREMLEARKDLPPEKTPLWDSVLVYPIGANWKDRSPAPVWWTKQTSYSGEEKPGELTAVFSKNSTRKPPVRSDWYLEAREAWQMVNEAKEK